MKLQASESLERDGMVDLSDIDVFQRQYKAYFRQLKYFGMRYLDNEEVVCDLIQDLWLKMWERREGPMHEAAFKQFLYRSLYRAILNHIKHNNVVREYAAHSAADGEELEDEVTYKIIEAEVYRAVNQVFDSLPDACRRVYAASLDGKSQKEIAEEFYISVNTVKKHINNANHYMKKHLQDFLQILLCFR